VSDFNLIPFGFNPIDETFVDVEDVPRGVKCGCICPACKTPLIARQGEEKEWHFAHASRKVYSKTQKECEFSFYLSVRMMARQIIGNELDIRLPEYQDSVSQYVPALGYSLHEPFLVTESKEICLTNVEVETSFGGVAVDIVGYISDFKFVIYFTHPGRIIPQELKSPTDYHCGVISIALDELRSSIFRQAKRENKSYQSALIEYLSNDVSSKHWIFHPRFQRCHQQAIDRLKEKTKSYPEKGKPHRKRSIRFRDLSISEDFNLTAPDVQPTKQRVLFECVICKSQWQGFEPGGEKCPKCNTHLYTTKKEVRCDDS